MNRTQPWQSYRTIATQTASPGQLVLMLFDGAIRFLEQALRGFEQADPLEFNRTIHNNVVRAQNILNELNGTLDLNQGGDLALTLRRLYDYMDRRLMESNVKKTREGIQDTVRRLTVLRDAWREMLGHATRADGRSEALCGLSACG